MSIQAYQKNQAHSLKITDFAALLLTKAASHIKKAVEAMAEKDIEKQHLYTNIACDILQGLRKYVVEVNPEQAKVAQTLRNYYADMIVLITRMKVKNDVKAAQAIILSLEEVSEMWRMISREMNSTIDYEAMKKPDLNQPIVFSA